MGSQRVARRSLERGMEAASGKKRTPQHEGVTLGRGGNFGGFGGFGGFWSVWSVCGLANGTFESHRKLCCGLGPGVPVGEVALALGCLLGGCLEGLEGFGGFWSFGGCVWRVWMVLEGLECLRAGKRQL